LSVFYGVDLGSSYVKVACVEYGEYRFLGPYETAEFYRTYIEPGPGGGVLRRAALGLDEGAALAATGYGRARLGGGAVMVPELEAIVAGAAVMTGLQDAVILDVGGQDSKAIVVRGGRMVDFAANDRCAASSGKFMQNMSAALGMSLREMGEHWRDPVGLSSTCAIFGETELVGLMGEGYALERLAAGVNHAILRRLLPLISRFEVRTLVLTGGVAYNKALRELLGERLGFKPLVPRPPDFVAAVGCCGMTRKA
jgi:(R)-2-hydroxyacyl-CoA dehydratese activating ATPase